jgi:ribose transport system ATP-binding protein
LSREILFKAENVTMKFPGTIALSDVNLEIRKGEVVGLIGENGAGKSTLMKIIMGIESQTSGTMMLGGKKYEPKDPKEANLQGVGMVFQEQSLIANLTVGQNIYFGKEQLFKKFGFIFWHKMYKEAAKTLQSIDIADIHPQTKVRDLNFSKRQMVEIARVFNSAKTGKSESPLILLDEPTSVLNDDEIKQLFSQVHKIKEEGNAVVFVSHRLDEVMEICDRIYVFKDGKNVGVLMKEEADESKLYEMMVGRTSSGEYYKVDRQTVPAERLMLEVDKLGSKGQFKDVSFQLHAGEVLGICGVVGSGKEALCSVISGDEKATSGVFKILGKAVEFESPCEALKNGIICIPKERREEGIVSTLSILENICLSNLDHVKKGFFISKQKQVEQAAEWIEKLRIKCSGHSDPVANLSGGNAQKVVFSRILSSGAKILILDHPTRGVDVGAKEEIYSLVRDVTAQGYSVILLGDTLDECIGLSSKVLVMKDGAVTKVYEAPAHDKPEQVDIVRYMM